MEPTKRPLRLRPVTNSPSTEGVYHLRNDDQGHRIGLVYERNHAVAIVLAVNHFEEMRETLQELEEQVFNLGLSRLTEKDKDACAQAAIKARALLAKIKEG